VRAGGARRNALSGRERSSVSTGRAARGSSSSERTATAVVPLPGTRTPGLELGRFLPSARSLLTTVAIAVTASAAYFVARDTGIFAIRRVEVDGASPAVVQQVRRVLRDDVGTSLMRLDTARARALVASVPTVASASLDRAFPHTLKIVVVPERRVAVVRQGADSWLVSARGRVMARLGHGALKRLPRIWVGHYVALELGGTLPATLHDQLSAVAPLTTMRFPARVTSVRLDDDELTLLLRSGLQVRLGDATDVALKLAVAAKVLHLIPADTRYVDVSVPERPVAGSIFHAPKAAAAGSGSTSSTAQTTTAAAAPNVQDGAASTLNSQVKGETSTSSTP